MGMGQGSLLQTQQRLTRQLTPLLPERSSGDIDDDDSGDRYMMALVLSGAVSCLTAPEGANRDTDHQLTYLR